MQGLGKDIHLVRILHQLPEIHDPDLVTDVFDHADVVGDEQIGQLVFVLDVHEQIEDLGLNGHVQGGDGLVGDDQ